MKGTIVAMLPALLGLSLASLLVGSGSPAEPHPGTPVEARGDRVRPTPPVLPATPAAADPEAPAEPEVVPEPVVGVEPVGEPLPPVETSPPLEAPVMPVPVPEPELAPGLVGDELDAGWVTVKAPRWRGTGLFIGSGALFASAVIFQLVDGLSCGDCALGVTERAFLAAGMGLAAGGGVMRGRADAYDDTALRRKRPDTRPLLIAGAALVGVGAVVGLVNDGLWWRCVTNASGPYSTPSDGGFGLQCRYDLTRGLLDLGAASAAAGLGMLTWSLAYRRDARAYQRARVIGLRPTFGHGRWGMSLGGRF
jgi:hypothetical protein